MDLLFITKWPPDENGGGTQQRAAASLRALAACGRVHMLCLRDEPVRLPEPLRPLVATATSLGDIARARGRGFRFNERGSPWQRLLHTAWGMSGLIAQIDDDEAAGLAQGLPRQDFDGMFAFHLGSACVGDRLQVLKPGARRVIDWDFLESPNVVPVSRLERPDFGWQDAVRANFNRIKVRHWETRILSRWEVHLCSSSADVGYLRQRARQDAEVVAVNNTALVGDHCPPPASGRPPTVLFVGTMAYGPNLDAVQHFVADIWPTIRRRLPAAEFKVVGRAVPPSLMALAGRDGISIHADVPDVAAFYDQSHVAVVPLRFVVGSNLKVPEAMALGRPVVGYRAACARHGLGDADGVLSVDDPQAFADRVLGLLTDLDGAARMGVKAHRAALDRFSRGVVNASLARTLMKTFQVPR